MQADHAVVVVEKGDTGDHASLVPSADTFLQTQLVLCVHIIEYGAMTGRTGGTNLQWYASSILAYVCEMVRDHLHDERARLAHNLMMRNMPASPNFLLPASFMDDIYENGDKSTAWLANLEALGQAFTLVLNPSMNVTVALDDGLCKVTGPTSHGDRVYVASFANDPIENQAWIFQKELHDIDDDVLQRSALPMTIEDALVGTMQSPSVVATVRATAPGSDAKVDDAARADTGQQAPVDDSDIDANAAAVSRSLQMQSELIRQEEEEAAAPDAAVAQNKKNTKNKKNKKKKRTCTKSAVTSPTVCKPPVATQLPQAEDQAPSAHGKPSAGVLPRELHEVHQSCITDATAAPQSALSLVPNVQTAQDLSLIHI